MAEHQESDHYLLLLVRTAIREVERIGVRSESGMLANENYPALLTLRQLERALKMRLAGVTDAREDHPY